MEHLSLFITAALTALAIENMVFARALGLSRDTMFMSSAKAGIIFGGTLTWMALFSSLFVSLANYILVENPYILILRPIAYLLGVIIVYIATSYSVGYILPDSIASGVHEAMPVSTFNSALFGYFFVSASQSLNFIQTVGYSLGTGLGYTGAILVIYFGRKRLAISPIPRSFMGLPILLIYLGLISLAIFGLVGHVLPT